MIHHGDLFDVLPTLPADFYDACVTDPPYGIGFMGREWDTFKPGTGHTRRLMHPREREAAKKIVSDNPNINGRHRSPALSPSQIDYDYSTAGLRRFQEWTEEWAREVFRVLKPGAYIVASCAPRSYHRMACGLEDAGFVIRDEITWLFGSGFPKNRNLGEGKGTALKPAHEPIALAWKPFKGSIRSCHEAHGTAALNIDASRIPTTNGESLDGGRVSSRTDGWDHPWKADTEAVERCRERIAANVAKAKELGRWPANVALDEEAAAMLDEQTGVLVSGANPTRRASNEFRNSYGEFKGREECVAHRGIDTGGASRFYYVAKPSTTERNLGCGGLPGGNIHPTVKPVALMRWLVRLVAPVNGAVLDPFTGSGTTAMACAYESRRFIGVEREPEYVEIARRRIAAVAPLFAAEAASNA